MKVLSLNVSQAKQIQHRGKAVDTGIFKKPVHTPVQVSSDGIDGDRQCDLINHGGSHKAVYGFSLSHYPYWKETLNQPGLTAGAFGENLSMSELDEVDLCIGDRLNIGTAVLEVSQPRVPCFKLGIALADDRAPALFTRHFHTGVYFRVIQAGEIATGDEATISYRHPDSLSIHRLFRAMFDRRYSKADGIFDTAAQIPELAPEWQEKVHKRLGSP